MWFLLLFYNFSINNNTNFSKSWHQSSTVKGLWVDLLWWWWLLLVSVSFFLVVIFSMSILLESCCSLNSAGLPSVCGHYWNFPKTLPINFLVLYSANILLNFDCFLFLQGMELYPRIGKNFDIKVFTNCRFGMMSWAVLAVTYCIKQVASMGWLWIVPNCVCNSASLYLCLWCGSMSQLQYEF